jgi:protein gp37
MTKTSISWCLGPDGAPGFSWNPVVGCSPVSAGCTHCWAARLASTRLAHLPEYKGLTEPTVIMSANPPGSGPGPSIWTGQTRFLPDRLGEPLRRRQPSGIAVGLMGDIGHPTIRDVDRFRIWLTMARASWHQFFVLTKRPAELSRFIQRWCSVEEDTLEPRLARGPEDVRRCYRSERARLFADMLEGMGEPPPGAAYPTFDWMEGPRWLPSILPNVAIGVSMEDQATADERIPELLQIPAAVRFVSAEPLLGPVNFCEVWMPDGDGLGSTLKNLGGTGTGIDWIVVGGESGSQARPCSVDWIRSIVGQCREAGVPCWVKQLGTNCVDRNDAGFDGAEGEWPTGTRTRGSERFQGAPTRIDLRDRAGADPSEWPEDLRVRQMLEACR